jgi:hypothetical protein
MADIEHKLHYAGVDWKKINKKQEEKWASRSGSVTVVKEGDPQKTKQFKKSRQNQGLNKAKKQKPSLCQVRKHDWEGEYNDGWLTLNCLICKIKNVSYKMSKRELECIENGWWTVNDLYIRVDKKGYVIDSKGGRRPKQSEFESMPSVDPFDLTKLSIGIQEYKAPTKSNGNTVKNDKKFYLPPMKWQWTIYRGFDAIRYGYAHTREDALKIANETMNGMK